jgi:hypothetical protein
LLKAATGGDANAVRDALKRGADINGRTTGGNNALALAAAGGHLDAVKELIKAGADINDGGRRFRPLNGAAHSGHLQVVKFLVEAGAEVNLPDPDSADNALYFARVNNKSDVAKYLKSAGARLPQIPVKPFTPGVEFPDTCVEALVKAPVKQVADALAEAIKGAALHDVWGKSVSSAGKLGYGVIRLEGSDWTSVMGLTGTESIIDDAWRDLAKALSKACKNTNVFSL